jgi:hypothetical protein
MELDPGGGVSSWRLTGDGSEVGEKLQGVEAVLLSGLSGARMVEKTRSHSDPERRRRGSSSARWMQCLREVMGVLVSFTGSWRS